MPFKQYEITQSHTVIVDVADDAEHAVQFIREILPPKYGKVSLHSSTSPSGCPQVSVRLKSKRMAQFLKDYYPGEHTAWLSERATPPVPHRYFA